MGFSQGKNRNCVALVLVQLNAIFLVNSSSEAWKVVFMRVTVLCISWLDLFQLCRAPRGEKTPVCRIPTKTKFI